MQKNYMTFRVAALISFGITLVLLLPILIMASFGNFLGFQYNAIQFTMSAQHYAVIAYNFIANFLFILLLFLLNFRILSKDIQIRRPTLILIIGNIFSTVLGSLLLFLLRYALFETAQPISSLSPVALEILLCNFSLVILVVFISQIIYLSQKKQQIALQYEALKTENIRIRYEALKNQIDPHFLFNTMSILDSLIGIDQLKAQEYVQKFSSAFRYMLQNKDVVTLNEELNFTYNYCDLMRIRYGDNLIINFNVDEKFGNYVLVSLGLQTLVENAIKHNVISKQKPLTVTIDTTEDGSLCVRNNFQPKDIPQQGSGIGLSNLAERYHLKWQKGIQIKNSGTTFCVTIPLIKN